MKASAAALPFLCAGFALLISGCSKPAPANTAELPAETHSVTGVVREIRIPQSSVVITHAEVPGYMAAMTMPFKVRDASALGHLHTNQAVVFRLNIRGDESWIDNITTNAAIPAGPDLPKPSESKTAAQKDPEPFVFTNEFGVKLNLTDFRDQALALTFFFTRCPVPDYCPRLSKNFAEASQKLAASPEAPPRWHFLSISIDPEHDTPEVLRRYAETYHYNSNHWSFITGPKERVAKLAHSFGFEYQPEGTFFNHSFRTVIINCSNRVQQIYPYTGNFSEDIVSEMIKAGRGEKTGQVLR